VIPLAAYNRFEFYKNINNFTDMNHIFMAVNWCSNPDAVVIIINTVISTGEKTTFFKKTFDFYAAIKL